MGYMLHSIKYINLNVLFNLVLFNFHSIVQTSIKLFFVIKSLIYVLSVSDLELINTS